MLGLVLGVLGLCGCREPWARTCQLTSDCGSGMYCGPEKFCTQDCVVGSKYDCPNSCACNEVGQCVDLQSGNLCSQPASTGLDAGS